MRDCIEYVNEAYTCLLNGSPPNQRATDLATNIHSILCGNASVQEDYCSLCEVSNNKSKCFHTSMTELNCITLTLINKIISDLMSKSMRPETRIYFLEVSKLFQEEHLMSRIVHQFQAEDRLISHLAAKFVSTYVFYELQHFREISHIWQQTCVQMFQNACTPNELDPCIWSFTSVFKTILKDSHEGKTEILEKLLIAFDPHLSILFSKFLSEDTVSERPNVVHLSTTQGWGPTYSTLLDLLEILSASRLTCSTSVCLQSQRLAYMRAPALLKMVVSSSFDYYVKKQVLLLVKITLLQKAGEDMALKEASAASPRDEHFRADMVALASSVLQAASADWLQFVPVQTAVVSFGGPSLGPGESDQKPDHVMLRAVCLVVLKSLELALQPRTGADCAAGAHLRVLLRFLRDRGFRWTEPSHPCCWYTAVFGEQDDDMMEAAKALLTLFLRSRSSPGLNPKAESETACVFGFNPHCHFLLLIRSISFDHSVLLDFLISTETCFLEYFVRYLKHLKADSSGFLLACRRMDESDARLSLSISCCDGGSSSALSHKQEPRSSTDPGLASLWTQPVTTLPPKVGVHSLVSGLCLVDYSSSEESGTDDMEVSHASHDTGKRNMWLLKPADCELHSFCSSDAKQDKCAASVSIRHTPAEHNLVDTTAQTQTEFGPGQEGPLKELFPSASKYGQSSGLTHRASGKTVSRTLLCLSELRKVVTKLHLQNLFPYKPQSLLKLLSQVETVNQFHTYPN